jgi:arylformamidase
MKLYRHFSSQEEIDQQYNIQVRVPDLVQRVAQMEKASARVRRELDAVTDVSYGPTVDETMDIFPASDSGAPILVFIHGGYWRSFGSKEFSLIARGPVSNGVTVAIVNYSLCPKVTISEITRQSRAAIACLFREGHRFHGDPNRIFVCGHSAGGQQVGMLAATDWAGEYALPQDIIKGGIPISGIFDLAPLVYSWLQPKLLLTHETVVRESPLFHIPRRGFPLLISLGEDESGEFHRQSNAFLQAWRKQGLSGTLLVQPGKNHLSAIEELGDPHSAFCRAVIDFIRHCEKRA